MTFDYKAMVAVEPRSAKHACRLVRKGHRSLQRAHLEKCDQAPKKTLNLLFSTLNGEKYALAPGLHP